MQIIKTMRPQLFVLLYLFFSSTLFAQTVITDGYITDHMVIQKNKPFWFRGEDDPGQIISLDGFGINIKSQTDAKGQWAIKLPPLAKNQKSNISIHGSSSIVIRDVVAGDVWFVVGQSNIQMPLHASDFDIEELGEEFDKRCIRVYHQPKLRSSSAVGNGNGLWLPLNKRNASKYSAIGVIFSYYLSHSLDHPIGIIVSSWGSSHMNSWFPGDDVFGVTSLAEFTFAIDQKKISLWQSRYGIYLDEKQQYPDGGMPRSIAVPRKPHSTGDLFNGMVLPFTKFPVSGIVYYQGESDVKQPNHLRNLFPPLIRSYRRYWNISDLPFLYVQIPRWDFDRKRDPKTIESEIQQQSLLAELRVAQEMASHEVSRTGMVVTIDTGDYDDIHPKGKSVVGERLANAALDIVYNKKTLWRGPTLDRKAVQQTSDNVIITFKYVGNGIEILGDEIKGFTIASDDSLFRPANAELIGPNQISIEKNMANSHITIRYAWKDYPFGNIYDSARNPARPFKVTIPLHR